MALVYGSDFENATGGDVLSGPNSGSDFVVATGGSAIITNIRSAHGTKSAEMTATSTSGGVYFQQTFAAVDTIAIRAYVYLLSTPSTATGIIWLGSGTSQTFTLELATDKKLILRDDNYANVYTSPTAIPAGWHRIALSIKQSPTVGTARLALYALDSTTPIFDSTTLTNLATGAAAMSTIRMGPKVSTGTTTLTMDIDDWTYSPGTTTFIGPVVAQSPPLETPVVTLGAYVNPTTVGGSNGSQTVSWPAVSGAVAYDAYLAQNGAPSQGDFIKVATGVVSPYTFTNLQAGTQSAGIRAR